MLTNLNIVLGGARSGKSAFAERLVRHDGRPRAYIATAQAFDDEMRDRIAKHRVDRGENWLNIEEPLELATQVQALQDRADCGIVLVDCLTLWLSNLLLADRDILMETGRLFDAFGKLAKPVICVSNEVGMGLVPDTPLGRAFRDAQGRLNQQIAARSERVVFVAAGLPLMLKGTLPENFT